MEIKELSNFIENTEYVIVENFFTNLKINNKIEFKNLVEKTKIIFINTDESGLIDKISLLYNEFKIHSGVPLIVSKLLIYDKNSGGTMLYSLKGLKWKVFESEILGLLDEEISYEMRCMIELLY
jgi:hypothetical protein